VALVLHLALSLALANLLVHEGLLAPLRQRLDRALVPHDLEERPLTLRLLRKLVSCAPCASFWTGALVSLAVLSPARSLLEVAVPVAAILDGLLAHAAALPFFALLDRLSP